MKIKIYPYNIAKYIAWIYVLSVLYLTLLYNDRYERFEFVKNYNFKFFSGKIHYIKTYAALSFEHKLFIISEIAGNILLFAPFAWACYIIVGRKLSNVSAFFIVLFSILSVEATQFLLHTGIFDVDDIVLNLSGGILGIGIFNIIYKTQLNK